MKSRIFTSKELDFVISQGEGQFTEFKEKIDKSFSKEIVAFANSTGGNILIGINDCGDITGAKLNNKLKSKIIDTAMNCDPKILVKIQEIENIINVIVPDSNNKPHSCSSGFFLRVGANSQKMTRDEIFAFAISHGIKAFDEELNYKFSYPDDFDQAKFSDYLKAAKIERILPNDDILQNLKVAEIEDDKLIFNNTGVLFFAKNPSKFFFSSQVVCGEFAYNDKVKILDKKVYDDGILANIKQAISFITKRIKVEFVIKSAKRKEIPQFPEETYREAVVNAIMHRDYFDKSSDVFVEVYRNKIIITNPGGLVKWLKKEDFGKLSKTRNSVIASLLARTEFVEKMGTGIKRMNNAMTKAGLPEMEFDFNEHTFYTIIKDGSELSEKEETGAETTQKTTQKTTQISTKEIIISRIKENPHISRRELALQIENISEDGVKYHLKKLKKENIIRRIGPDRGGYWEILDNETKKNT